MKTFEFSASAGKLGTEGGRRDRAGRKLLPATAVSFRGMDFQKTFLGNDLPRRSPGAASPLRRRANKFKTLRVNCTGVPDLVPRRARRVQRNRGNTHGRLKYFTLIVVKFALVQRLIM